MLQHIKVLRGKGKPVRIIRCNNAGKNLKFHELSEMEGLNLTFEFTAPGTPQQNGLVERMFATLTGRVHSMMNRARFTRAK